MRVAISLGLHRLAVDLGYPAKLFWSIVILDRWVNWRSWSQSPLRSPLPLRCPFCSSVLTTQTDQLGVGPAGAAAPQRDFNPTTRCSIGRAVHARPHSPDTGGNGAEWVLCSPGLALWTFTADPASYSPVHLVTTTARASAVLSFERLPPARHDAVPAARALIDVIIATQPSV